MHSIPHDFVNFRSRFGWFHSIIPVITYGRWRSNGIRFIPIGVIRWSSLWILILFWRNRGFGRLLGLKGMVRSPGMCWWWDPPMSVQVTTWVLHHHWGWCHGINRAWAGRNIRSGTLGSLWNPVGRIVGAVTWSIQDDWGHPLVFGGWY